MVTESLFRRKGNPLSRCEPVESSTEDLTEPQVSHIAKAGIESEIGEDQVRICNFNNDFRVQMDPESRGE